MLRKYLWNSNLNNKDYPLIFEVIHMPELLNVILLLIISFICLFTS